SSVAERQRGHSYGLPLVIAQRSVRADELANTMSAAGAVVRGMQHVQTPSWWEIGGRTGTRLQSRCGGGRGSGNDANQMWLRNAVVYGVSFGMTEQLAHRTPPL